jgi:L-threonylcarbamoyladenylate synthase
MTVSARDVARAADALRAHELVAFPTETVYGLGADASSPEAMHRLYAAKGRPADHPVIVHVADASALDAWVATVPDVARQLAAGCWPGPLTLVLARARGVLDEVTGGLDTVGVRVPDQPVALALLREFGGGIAAPSANRFGRVSPTTAAAVHAELGDRVAVVLDGGPCHVGVESTIVDCTSDTLRVLRIGGIARDRIEAVTGATVVFDVDAREGATRAPGTLASHYAPRARVELTTAEDLAARVERARDTGARVGVVSCGDVPAVDRPPFDRAVVLGTPATPEAYAHDLYALLRTADDQGIEVVVAVVPTDDGIGAAVADRLRRAAAPRPDDMDDDDPGPSYDLGARPRPRAR